MWMWMSCNYTLDEYRWRMWIWMSCKYTLSEYRWRMWIWISCNYTYVSRRASCRSRSMPSSASSRRLVKSAALSSATWARNSASASLPAWSWISAWVKVSEFSRLENFSALFFRISSSRLRFLLAFSFFDELLQITHRIICFFPVNFSLTQMLIKRFSLVPCLAHPSFSIPRNRFRVKRRVEQYNFQSFNRWR